MFPPPTFLIYEERLVTKVNHMVRRGDLMSNSEIQLWLIWSLFWIWFDLTSRIFYKEIEHDSPLLISGEIGATRSTQPDGQKLGWDLILDIS